MNILEGTNVRVEQRDGCLVATVLAHRLSDFETPGMSGDLLGLLPRHGGRLVLDLGGVELMSSAGLGLLIQLRKACEGCGGRFVVCGLNEELFGLMKLTNLHRLVRVADDTSGALAAMSER